jgi:hypothetical protein
MRGIDRKCVKMLAGSFLEDIPLSIKRPIHAQLNWAILLCDVIPDGKTE